MQISFKNDNLFRTFCTIPRHAKLVEVLLWISKLKKVELIVTSDFREKPIHKKDPGIHGTKPLRAIDLRSWTIRNPEIIRDKINEAWIYDPNRPKFKVCVYHSVVYNDGTPGHFHFHIQVCDNTKKHPDKTRGTK